MKQIERNIGIMMRIGVGVALAFILVGFVLFAVNGTLGYADDQVPNTLTLIAKGLAGGYSGAYMMTGILCLMLTPVLRVVISIITFAMERNKLYVCITSIVLVILCCCLIVGFWG